MIITMGRKYKNPAGEMFFLYDPVSGTSTCDIPNYQCGVMKGQQFSTLEKHV